MGSLEARVPWPADLSRMCCVRVFTVQTFPHQEAKPSYRSEVAFSQRVTRAFSLRKLGNTHE